MNDQPEIRVASPPARPLVVYDGECAFCRQCVERVRRISGEAVDYRPFQEAAGDFPEIGRENFEQRVYLIEPDGRATGGAEAAFRLYDLLGEHRWLLRLYREVPAFTAATDAGYHAVATHRNTAAFLVRWLWGSVDQRPRYRRMRNVLLRGIAAVYLVAFASLAVQVDGLYGSRGIVPVADSLDAIGRFVGPSRHWELPSLLWIDPSDRTLHLLCWGGVAVAAMVIVGVLPKLGLAWLWASYLSFVAVGAPFLPFQWDTLLLESGLLAVLFAPWGPWLGRSAGEPSHLVVFLFRWLVFRLMFLSGVVKLTSNDPTWWAWRAMEYHYETQPLPSWTSWYAHQAPRWFHSATVGFMFWAELVAPFLVFAPRLPRLVGFASLVLLQLGIAATGNYGFFNLLSIVLCLSLLEDRDLGRRDADAPRPWRPWWLRLPMVAVALVIVAITTMEGLDRSGFVVIFPERLESLRARLAPIRSLNAYGLFAVMTTERPEIIVEGSDDGLTWTPYTFRWKPGDVRRRPRFAGPHMPRLDWQMWFAALSPDCTTQPWFLRFERRLREGSPPVLRLLADNPFPDRPPRFIRARLYRYRFTHRGAEAWWTREPAGLFCPAWGGG